MWNEEKIKACIEDTNDRIDTLKGFVQATDSSLLPIEIKSKVVSLINPEIEFLEGLKADDIDALEQTTGKLYESNE
jgi:hypothetical protein